MDETTFHSRIKVAVEDSPKVSLFYRHKYRWDRNEYALMEHECKDDQFNYYSVSIPYIESLTYYFILEDEMDKVYYTQWGIKYELDNQNDHLYFFQYPYIHKESIHFVPGWVKESVFYQIFTDRFYRKSSRNDSQRLKEWNSKPDWDSFYGGDLEGVIDKIDYFTVDPCFGDLDILKKLVDKCHENNIRVILDGVFNHCSYRSNQFQDVIKHGKSSKFFDWFYVKDIPINSQNPNYEIFSTLRDMPKLNTENETVREYLLSIVKYWIKEVDIDGWRLDVADELSPSFLKELRRTVKACKKDAYILGESWYDANSWLLGEQEDAVMNYQLLQLCVDHFALNKISATDFMQQMCKVTMCYTRQVNEVNFNLIESHDTARFMTLCEGNTKKLMLAATLLLTFVGTPCIYYGMEVGIEGGEDPDCRRTFNWDNSSWNSELFQYIKKLIHIRKEHDALQKGDIRWVENGNNVVIYERVLPSQKIIVILNNCQEAATIALENEASTYTEMITGNRYQDCIQVEEYGAKLLICQ